MDELIQNQEMEGRTNDKVSLTKLKETVRIAGLVVNPTNPPPGQPNICTNPFCQICHGINGQHNHGEEDKEKEKARSQTMLQEDVL